MGILLFKVLYLDPLFSETPVYEPMTVHSEPLAQDA